MVDGGAAGRGLVHGIEGMDMNNKKRGGGGEEVAYQVWQMTEETVVMGTLMVQGQSEMVRVVAWRAG